MELINTQERIHQLLWNRLLKKVHRGNTVVSHKPTQPLAPNFQKLVERESDYPDINLTKLRKSMLVGISGRIGTALDPRRGRNFVIEYSNGVVSTEWNDTRQMGTERDGRESTLLCTILESNAQRLWEEYPRGDSAEANAISLAPDLCEALWSTDLTH